MEIRVGRRNKIDKGRERGGKIMERAIERGQKEGSENWVRVQSPFLDSFFPSYVSTPHLKGAALSDELSHRGIARDPEEGGNTRNLGDQICLQTLERDPEYVLGMWVRAGTGMEVRAGTGMEVRAGKEVRTGMG